MFDSSEIELNTLTKDFIFQKFVRTIDSCDDVGELQEMCKYLVKLNLKQQEVTAEVIGKAF